MRVVRELPGNAIEKEREQVPVIRLEWRLVRAREFQQLRYEQRKDVLGGFRNFEMRLVLAGPGEVPRGGHFEVCDDVQDFGQHLGWQPAHLRDILANPENLRVNRSRAYEVERHLQHEVQVTYGIMVPRKIAGAQATKRSHHVGDGEVALDDLVGEGLLEIPVPAVLVEQAQLLVFHEERLGVVHAEMFRENVKAFEVAEEFVACLEFVGKALAEIPRRAELREVLQHGGQNVRVVLPALEIEFWQLLGRDAVLRFAARALVTAKETFARVFGMREFCGAVLGNILNRTFID